MKSLKAFFLALLMLSLGSVAFAADDAAPATDSPKININTADASQLALLPRIGPKVAQSIVDYREANGPFRKATDLLQVKGIGDKSFELLRPYLVTEGRTTLTSKQKAPRSASSRARQSSSQPSSATQ